MSQPEQEKQTEGDEQKQTGENAIIKKEFVDITDENRAEAYLHFFRIGQNELFMTLVEMQPLPEALRDASSFRFATELTAIRENGVEILADVVTRLCSKFGVIYRDVFVKLSLPFVLIGMSQRDCFLAACVFVKRYTPFVLVTCENSVRGLSYSKPDAEELIAQQKIEKSLKSFFRLLIRYHSPTLEEFFENSIFPCEEKFLNWINTLFIDLFSFSTIIPFIDFYLQRAESTFFMFFGLAILLSHSKKILEFKAANDVSDYLDTIVISTTEELKALLLSAANLARNTPLSFRKQVLACLTNSVHYHMWVENYCQNSVALHVSILDVMEDLNKRKLKYLIIDCRPKDSFTNQGSVPSVYHVDSARFYTPIGLASVTQEISEIALRCEANNVVLHVCVCGIGRHSTADEGTLERTMLLASLVQTKIKFISILHNGFLSCHEHFLRGSLELHGHNEQTCSLCIARREEIVQDPLEVVKSTGTSIWNAISSGISGLKQRLEQAQAITPEPPQGSGALVEEVSLPDEENTEYIIDVKALTKDIPLPLNAFILNPIKTTGAPSENNEEEQKTKNPATTSSSMFAIDDDDEEEEEEEKEEEKEKEKEKEIEKEDVEEKQSEELLNADFRYQWGPYPLNQWIDSDVTIHQCYYVQKGSEEKRFFAFLPDQLVCLRCDPFDPSFCVPTCRHPYEGITTIVFHKRTPKEITINFKDFAGVEDKEYYHVESTKDLFRTFRSKVSEFAQSKTKK